jgi:hypothetical protein
VNIAVLVDPGRADLDVAAHGAGFALQRVGGVCVAASFLPTLNPLSGIFRLTAKCSPRSLAIERVT